MRRLMPLLVAIIATGCHFSFDRALEPGQLRGNLVFATGSGSLEAAAGATISLENSGIAVKSDERGNFVFRNLQQGTYAITIKDASNTHGLRLRNLSLASGPNGLGESRDLGQVELGAFGSLSGTVTPKDSIKPGTIVTIAGNQKMDVADGAYASTDLVPGDYDLTLFAPATTGAYVTGPVTVTVKPGANTPVDAFQLDMLQPSGSGALSGHAILTGVGSNQDILVNLTPTSSQLNFLETDSSGLYSATQIEAGVYTVTASLNGIEASVPFVVVGNNDTTEVPLIVVPGAGEELDGGPSDQDAGITDAGTTDGGSNDQDGGPADGGCGDLDNDVNNCGSCGHVCQTFGGRTPTCEYGACLTTIAATQPNAQGLLVDGTNAYWYSSLTTGGFAILKAPLAGGDPVTLGTQGNSFALGQDADNLYAASVTDIQQLPKAGGAAATIIVGMPFDARTSIAVDDTSVYWTNFGSSVKGATIAGGTRSTLTSDQGQTRGIAVDATNVYWSDTMNGTIVQIPKAGGAEITLATGQNALNLVVDGTSVHWANYLNPGSIVKAPIGGGTVTTLDSTHSNFPEGLVVDETNVYWGNFGDGTIFKAPIAGGPAVRVTAEQANPPCIAVDATHIYWSTSSAIIAAEK